MSPCHTTSSSSNNVRVCSWHGKILQLVVRLPAAMVLALMTVPGGVHSIPSQAASVSGQTIESVALNASSHLHNCPQPLSFTAHCSAGTPPPTTTTTESNAVTCSPLPPKITRNETKDVFQNIRGKLTRASPVYSVLETDDENRIPRTLQVPILISANRGCRCPLTVKVQVATVLRKAKCSDGSTQWKQETVHVNIQLCAQRKYCM